jgi:hypothetical protein
MQIRKGPVFAIVCLIGAAIVASLDPLVRHFAASDLALAVSACAQESALASASSTQSKLVCDPGELAYLRDNAFEIELIWQSIERSRGAPSSGMLGPNDFDMAKLKAWEKVRAGRSIDRPIQDDIIRLRHTVSRPNAGLFVLAVLIAIVGAAPMFLSWTWRFLLRRIAELATAFRGKAE